MLTSTPCGLGESPPTARGRWSITVGALRVHPLLQYHKLHLPNLKAGSNKKQFHKLSGMKMFTKVMLLPLLWSPQLKKMEWLEKMISSSLLSKSSNLALHCNSSHLCIFKNFTPNLSCIIHNCYKNSNTTRGCHMKNRVSPITNIMLSAGKIFLHF